MVLLVVPSISRVLWPVLSTDHLIWVLLGSEGWSYPLWQLNTNSHPRHGLYLDNMASFVLTAAWSAGGWLCRALIQRYRQQMGSRTVGIVQGDRTIPRHGSSELCSFIKVVFLFCFDGGVELEFFSQNGAAILVNRSQVVFSSFVIQL